jgi:hypothetical protein
MERLQFATSGEFMLWAQRIVRYQYQTYDRVPVGKQTWTYGDGHVVESEMGKRGARCFRTSLLWSRPPRVT